MGIHGECSCDKEVAIMSKYTETRFRIRGKHPELVTEHFTLLGVEIPYPVIKMVKHDVKGIYRTRKRISRGFGKEYGSCFDAFHFGKRSLLWEKSTPKRKLHRTWVSESTLNI
jgi:hypothetical protein